LNHTICNIADKWYLETPSVVYFLQHNEIPQVVKSHVNFPPKLITKRTVIFTTAKNKTEAAQKSSKLDELGFNVGMLQDMETLAEVGIGGLVKQYVDFFRLKPEHLSLMTTYFELWDKLRQCCGLQMSKLYRNERLPSSKAGKNPDMKQHTFCGSIDISGLEETYINTDMYKILNKYSLMRSINRPSLVDGDLNGNYCTRYNDAVRKHGNTEKKMSGLNSRYGKVKNHWVEETAPTFKGLQHLIHN
jgi:hypothetical protein